MYLKTNMTLTTFMRFMNARMVKKSRTPFTTGDIQGYIRRGKLPLYLGGNEIECNSEVEGVNLYNLKQN